MLSIVIPAREEEKVIGTTISRLKRGLTLPHEVIVSDGHSSDRTVEIARQYADKVTEFDGTVKHTAGRGRNDGAKVARGDFLVFMDADVTIPNPDAFFTRAYAHFDKDPSLLGLTGPQRALPEVETWGDWLSFGFFNLNLRFLNNVLHRGEASGKFIMVRREAFDRVGGFREDLVTREDGDFFQRLSKIGRVYFDPSLMVYHGSRRAHAVGWLKLWYIWIVNTIAVTLFDKAVADDWTPIR